MEHASLVFGTQQRATFRREQLRHACRPAAKTRTHDLEASSGTRVRPHRPRASARPRKHTVGASIYPGQ